MARPYQKTVLGNGITVLSEHIAAKRSAAVTLYFRAGTRDETDDEAGLTNLVRQLIFKGTPTRDSRQIPIEFESLGASYRSDTGREDCCFSTEVIADDLDRAFEILADTVCHPLFSQGDVEPQRKALAAQIDPSNLDDIFFGALLPNHPLGRRLLGTTETLARFEHDDCRKLHERIYRSGNLVVEASGDVSHAHMLELCERFLSDLPEGGPTVHEPIDATGAHPFAFFKKQTSQAHILYGTTSLPAGHPDRFAAEILDCVLGGTMSSRLFQEVREKRGLAYSVDAYSSRFSDFGRFTVSAGTNPTNIEQVVEVIRNVLEDAVDGNVTDAELERARNYLEGDVVRRSDSTRRSPDPLIENVIAGREPLSTDEVIAHYDAVTVDDVARVARDVLTRPMTLAITSPRESSELEKIFG